MGVRITDLNSTQIDGKVRLTGVKSLPRVFQDTILKGEGLNARTSSGLFGTVGAIDGNTAIVGVPGQMFDSSGGNAVSEAGSAYVFERTEEGWFMMGRLTAQNFPGGRWTGAKFGSSVDVSGYTAVVGAPGDQMDKNGTNAMVGAGAVYVFTKVGDFWQDTAKLTPPDRAAGDKFGSTVQCFGEVIVVGAPYQDTDAKGNFAQTDTGAIYVYAKVGDAWTFINKISSDFDSRRAGDQFGYAIAGDGNILAVAAPYQDASTDPQDTVVNAGAVYIFTWSADTQQWKQETKLVVPSRVSNDRAGIELAISNGRLAVGCPYDDSLDGSIHFFTRDNDGVWSFEQKISPASGTADAAFGSVMALSGDHLVTKGKPETTATAGQLLHYKRINGTWSLQQALPEFSDTLIKATSISLYDDLMIVGDPTHTLDESSSTNSKTGAGAAWLYQRNSTTGMYQLVQKFSGWGHDRNANDWFGASVDYDIETGILVVGAQRHGYDVDGYNYIENAGAVYVFYWNGTSWTFKQKIVPTGTNARVATDYFGHIVKIQGNRLIAVSVNHSYDENGSNYLSASGAIWVFKNDGVKFVQEAKIVSPSRYAVEGFGGITDFANTTLLVANKTSRKVYVYSFNGTQWTYDTTLISPDNQSGDDFGASISFKDDLILVGAPLHDSDLDNRNPLTSAGAAYLFKKVNGVWTYIQKIIGHGENRSAQDKYGTAVVGQGDTLVVTSTGDSYDANGRNYVTGAGAAYVWIWTGSSWVLQQKVVPSERIANDNFGWAVALDGDTMAVSSTVHSLDANGANSVSGAGAVWVFTRQFGVWSQVQKVVPEGTNSRIASDNFGTALSLNGIHLAVGVPYQDYDDSGANPITNAGAVFIFEKSGSTWVQKQKISAPSGGGPRIAGMRFGQAVDIRDSMMVIGAPSDGANQDNTQNISDAGSAYVFMKVGSTWNFAQKLVGTGSRQAEDKFGTAVAASGTTLVVGSPNHGYGANETGNYLSNSGAVYHYEWMSGEWMFRQKILPSERRTGDQFGSFLAIENDVLVVGVPNNSYDIAGSSVMSGSGSVFVFTRENGGMWSQSQKLVASDRAAGASFGSSVAVNGNHIIVGSPNCATDSNGVNSLASAGAVYVFFKTGTTFAQEAKLVAVDRAANDKLGSSIAIEGDVLISGAPYQDTDAVGGLPTTNPGAAYIWWKSNGVWTFVQKVVGEVLDRNTNDQFGWAVASYGSTIAVSANLQDYNIASEDKKDSAGAVYVFDWNGSVWSFRQKLVNSDRAAGDQFGYALAMWDDSLLVSAPYQDLDTNGANSVSNAGAVYVFTNTNGVWAQTQKIVPSGVNARGVDDNFGTALTIEGEYFAVSSPYHDYDETGSNIIANAGAVWVFKRNGISWEQTQKLIPTGVNARGANDKFGFSISIKSDVLLIGAPGHSYDVDGLVQAASAGAAWVFRRSGTTYSQEQKVVAWGHAENAGDAFGQAVSGDGDYLAIGTPGQDYDATYEASGRYRSRNYLADAGAVWIWKWDATNKKWLLDQKVVPSGNNARLAGDRFGSRVFLRGNILMVPHTNHQYDADGTNQMLAAGAVWVFERSGSGFTPWVQTAKLVPSGMNSRNVDDEFGHSVTTNGSDLIAVSSVRHAYDANGANPIPNAGAVWVFKKADGVWSQQKKIVERYNNDYPFPVSNGLLAWWDAQDHANLVTNGTSVSRWNCQNTSNIYASATATATAPTVTTLNGRQVVYFNASPLSIYDAVQKSNNKVTMFLSFYPTGGSYPFYIGTTNAGYKRLGFEYNNAASGSSADILDIFGDNGNDARATLTGISALNQWHVWTSQTDTTIHNSQVWNNGAAATMSTQGTNGSIDVSVSNTTLAGLAKIGDSSFSGYIGEILVYDRILTTDERKRVEAYLLEKWIGFGFSNSSTLPDTRPGG